VEEQLTIGQFSARCGLSAKVLRAYAAAGILVPAAVDAKTGYRYYETAQLEEAQTVRLLRRAGAAVADIPGFLADPSAEALDGWERSLSAEVFGRREALAELRRRTGSQPVPTRGATMIEIRPVADADELTATFGLLGAQLPEPLGGHDWRAHDLVARFSLDQPLMVVATEGDQSVGGALAFRSGDETVTIRIIGVVARFRHRGIGRRLVERVEAEARRLGSARVGAGTDEAIGFWCHVGYTPVLLLQWVYDPELFEPESEAVLGGPLAGLPHRRSSFNDVPQLFVELDEPRLDLRQDIGQMVTGCHVGFMVVKQLGRPGARTAA
jgi:DNA-binding transcriptional MerR regulator/predicted GNAT family acetyltransferase